jgi:hypothetical protein
MELDIFVLIPCGQSFLGVVPTEVTLWWDHAVTERKKQNQSR